ncbi:MAG: hypothetical protein GY719_13735 [bacterium]|nr:hypothetical protein [bacterium]
MRSAISNRSAGRPPGVAGWISLALLLPAILLPVAAQARQGDDTEPVTPREKAAREVAIAETGGRQVLQLRRHPDYSAAIGRDDEIPALLEKAQRLLGVAKSGLARAEQSQSATGYNDAAVLARRARSQFEEYEQRLQQAFDRIAAERAPPPPPPPPPPPELEPEAAIPEDSPLAAKAVGEPPPAAPPPPAPRRRGPSKKLTQIADAYFAGEYEQAVALASEAGLSRSRERAQAMLLRAAARYALFLLGGEGDYALRGQATEDVTACRKLDPDLEPDEVAFSPRFRDFFVATQ